MYYAATYHPDGRIERTYGASVYYDLMYQVGLSALPHAESTIMLRHDLHYWDGSAWAERPLPPDLPGGLTDIPFPPCRVQVFFEGVLVDQWRVTDRLQFALQDAGRWTVVVDDAFPVADRTYEITV